jgi:hypothetical protein
MPGLEADDVHCKLEHVSLDQQPDCEAISYVWGDQNNWREIVCETEVLRITLNLYSALIGLRSERESRVIWADAICRLTGTGMVLRSTNCQDLQAEHMNMRVID